MPASRRKPTDEPQAPAAPEAPATPEAPAPAGFTFGDAAVPEKTRVSTAVNPLLAVCKDIAATMGDDAERSTIAKTVTAADANQVAKIKRWLALAGQDLSVTFRSVVDDHNVVTFWCVKRIEHKNKGKNGKNGNGTAAEAPAAEAPAESK